METDTIREGMIIHLADDPSEIAATVDKETGNVIYSITFNSDDEAAKEDGGSNSFLWLGVALAVVVAVVLVIRYIWKKNRSNDGKAKQSEQDASLRYELLKHKEIYKKFCQKGYFSTVRKPNLDVVEGYEINELCDAVSEIFPPFVQFLNGHGLSAKDFQFCCLLKSGLSTFELAEIYCISESAIFKRRQKIKNQLGFESDNRTLDAIFEAIN
jgi:heme exporter protein D/DNA-binding CsgD family transcriptional regulator